MRATLVLMLMVSMLPCVAEAAPVFSVGIGPGSGSGCAANEGIGPLAIPVGVDHACSSSLGSAAAEASATFGSVGAAARSLTVTGSSSGVEERANAFFSDTLVFSKTDPSLPDQFPVSLNLGFSGVVNAGAGLGLATALVDITVQFQFSTSQLELLFNSGGFQVLNSGLFAGTGTIAPGDAGFDALLSKPGLIASIGEVFFSLQVATQVFSSGSGASATADFSNTLELPSGIDVFDLPPGYTVNAGDYLVDNRVVPEPSIVLLQLVVLLGLSIARRPRVSSR